MNIEDDARWNALSVDDKLGVLRVEAKAQRAIHSGYRARILIYSVIASGLVALFIGRAIEVNSINNQQKRSRENCVLAQRAIKLTADTYDDQADGLLGDRTAQDGDPNEHIPPFRLAGTPFAKFRPLLLAQAHANHDRAVAYRGLEENCSKVFPDIHFVFWG